PEKAYSNLRTQALGSQMPVTDSRGLTEIGKVNGENVRMINFFNCRNEGGTTSLAAA
ncbi:hypothetical protein P7K49_018250, partial [Saguinus oedipus]